MVRLTVYHHDQSFFADFDDEFALNTFPSVVVDVGEDESLRVVVDDALRKIGGHAKDEDATLSTGLAAWLAFPDPDQDPSVPTSWPTSHAYYGVLPDGRLLVEGWDLHRMTVGDLRRAFESGYVAGAWNQIVVLDPEGLGGPSDLVSPFLDFLAEVGFELVVGTAAYKAKQAKERIEQWRDDRRARALIESWHEHGLEGPWTLSAWIGRKVSWTASEVSTRLGVDVIQAESLLTALGYDYSERIGAWTVGTTRSAMGLLHELVTVSVRPPGWRS